MTANVNQTILKRDAQHNLLQESYFADMTFRAEYDGSGYMIYKGYARPGAAEDAQVWQVAFLTNDGDGNVTSITWPQGPNGAASSEYNFSWDDRLS